MRSLQRIDIAEKALLLGLEDGVVYVQLLILKSK